MRRAVNLYFLGAVAVLAAGLFVTGCKSAPPLTAQQAQQMIQAKYDQSAPTSIAINVSDLGMRQGITAGYWKRTLKYPNGYWADFTLTPEGKKLVTVQGGGDVIQWRPMTNNDSKYSVTVNTVEKTHLKAMNVRNIASEELPGASKAMGADYDEVENFEGIPAPLAQIGHNPGNQVSTTQHADFALVNGAWKLQGTGD